MSTILADTSPGALLSRVGLAQVLYGATRFSEGNVSDTYRGLVRTPEGDKSAIIKDLKPRELANEVLAAAIGLYLGLPIPSGYVALATPDRLQSQHGPELPDGSRLLYASLDVRLPQVAVICRGAAAPAVIARLLAWQGLGGAYGFDSLIANVDRHPGNLLFNGHKEVWLIDHGHAFTGPSWAPADLVPADKAVVSRLRQWLTPRLDHAQRSRVVGDATTIGHGLAGVDFAQVAVANHIADLLSEDDRQAVVSFLRGRLPHVPRLAAEAVEVLV